MNDKNYEYTLRAHHGMCLTFFKGNGYNREFVINMTIIQDRLRKNPDLKVKIVNYTEDICKACPENINGKCKNFEKVLNYDNKFLEYCGIKSGTILPFCKFEKLVNNKILIPGIRKQICGNCQWNEFCK